MQGGECFSPYTLARCCSTPQGISQCAIEPQLRITVLHFPLDADVVDNFLENRKQWQAEVPQTLLNFLADADVTSVCPTMDGDELGMNLFLLLTT